MMGDASASGVNLVVGGDGILGSALVEFMKGIGLPVTATTRRRQKQGAGEPTGPVFLDLSAPQNTWLLPEEMGCVFLCAAITDQRKCDAEPEETAKINVDATLRLAEMCHERGAFLVYVSTNAVFLADFGVADRMAQPQPHNAYGQQKQTVEGALLDLGSCSILRLAKVLSPTMPLIKNWVDRLGQGQIIEAFTDARIAPITLHESIALLTKLGEQRIDGIHHYAAKNSASYFDIAKSLERQLGVRDLVSGVASIERLGTKIPEHPRLLVNDDVVRLGFAAPDWSDVIRSLVPP